LGDCRVMITYKYSPKCAVVLAPWEASSIVGAWKGRPLRDNIIVEVGHSRGQARLGVDGTISGVSYCMGIDEVTANVGGLESAGLSNNKLLYYDSGAWFPLEVRSEGGYYKLAPTRRGSAPTLEINGIHMHRVASTDPISDTRAKIRAARIRRGVRVLDTCTGLGYTAIFSVLAGAASVVTVEVDVNVILISEYNPWSHQLADDRITTVNADVVEYVRGLEPNSFDRIIHDPPRLTGRTGDLYSEDFYAELYRVLRPGGILYHYTGEPGRRRGYDFPGKIAGKLRRVGFHSIKYDRRALGLVAFK